MDNGWIKLHRQTMDSSIFKNPKYWQIWCWCLLKATHKITKFPFNGKDIILKPGQFITGQEKGSKELACSVQNYKSGIKYLKLTNRLTTKSTNKFTIITVQKWDQYQLLTNKLTNQQPATNQPLTTYKNVKNVKKEESSKKKYTFRGLVAFKQGTDKWPEWKCWENNICKDIHTDYYDEIKEFKQLNKKV